MIKGLHRIPLARQAQDRGWFAELARTSSLPKPILRMNLSRSRWGVIRGGNHERGQDDSFVCLRGRVPSSLDGATSETFREGFGHENPVAICMIGINPPGSETRTDALFAYLATGEYDPADPDQHGLPRDDPRVEHPCTEEQPTFSAREAAAGQEPR